MSCQCFDLHTEVESLPPLREHWAKKAQSCLEGVRAGQVSMQVLKAPDLQRQVEH